MTEPRDCDERERVSRRKHRARLRCQTCGREFDPNWVRSLRPVIQGAVDGALKGLLREHPDITPSAGWHASLTKRIAGQITNKIWEVERGIGLLVRSLDDEYD